MSDELIGPWVFENRLKEIVATDDPEVGHYDADELMCDTLEGLGYDCAAFRTMTRWYA